ncbi:MAG: hypothetical protein HYW23_01985 [Candidatus Aenigmarchaeota archaeon]|nr:hypothetical protein [Candidatus Aenigmarchaeota archaeon]
MSVIGDITRRLGVLGTRRFQDGQIVWNEYSHGIFPRGMTFHADPVEILGYNPITRRYRGRVIDSKCGVCYNRGDIRRFSENDLQVTKPLYDG